MSLNQETGIITAHSQILLNAASRKFMKPKMTEIATELTPSARILTEHDKPEVVAFLNKRAIHTVNMLGLIADNGIQSSFNRGSFYGFYNEQDKIEGVALIGHATLVEARTNRALKAFAEVARNCQNKHLIMGEEQRIEEFWRYFSGDDQPMRLLCQERLFEMTKPAATFDFVPGLRVAVAADLPLIVPVQAQLSFDECGINPLEVDPEGFRRRCLRRIERGRTWILCENKTLIFKTEIMAATAGATYLEGVWVNPKTRGKGYGARCLSQLCRNLLANTDSLCLLINEKNRQVCDFYQKIGFEFQSIYKTIYLQKNKLQ